MHTLILGFGLCSPEGLWRGRAGLFQSPFPGSQGGHAIPLQCSLEGEDTDLQAPLGRGGAEPSGHSLQLVRPRPAEPCAAAGRGRQR